MKVNPFAIMREESDGTGIVFLPDENKIMTLNSSGLFLWKILVSGAAVSEAVRKMTEKFDVPQDRAEADISKFIETLRSKNLISGNF